MRRQNGIHLRLDPPTMARVEALAKGEPSNRSRILREAIDLRLNFETHALLMREVIEDTLAEAVNTFRQEATLLMRGQAEAAKAADALSCQRILDFIKHLGAAEPEEAPKPAPAAKGVTVPSTAVQLPARKEK